VRNAAAAALVFIGGFILMVIEVIGARFLPRFFGSSYHVWVSQIGVVMIGLAVGYYVGGALADRWQKASFLSILLIPAGIMVWFVPKFSGPLNAITERHPLGEDVPQIWKNLDPVLGSAMVFLFPCIVLAMLSPYVIRLITPTVAHVGRSSGAVIAASTVGSIAGVFVSGFVLYENVDIGTNFKMMGGAMIGLAFLCVGFDWLLATPKKQEITTPAEKINV
jgi:MFS family permease